MQRWLRVSLVVSLWALAGQGCSAAAPSLGPGGGGLDGDGDSGDGDEGDGDSGDGDTGNGDGDGDGDGVIPINDDCGTIEKTAELERGPIDIILALDSSGSMAGGICKTAEEISEFTKGVGPETHVAAVYTMNPLGPAFLASSAAATICGNADPLSTTALSMDSKRYLHVDVMVNSNDGFQVLLNNFDKYKGFLRNGAATHFIFVTDDDINGMDAATFKTQMEAKLGHKFTYNAVANGVAGCNGNSAQHLALADMTGGRKLGLCGDFGTQFADLQDAVKASAPLPCDFEIPAPPEGEELDIENGVRVLFGPTGKDKSEFPKASDASKCGDKDGWFNADGRIQFCPAACEKVKAGGTVSIGFGCQAMIL